MFKFVVTGFCLLFNGWSRATAQKVPGALQECTRSLQGWINYFIDLWLCCMFMTHWHSLLTFIHLESFEGLFQLSCCCKAWYSLLPIQTWTSRKSSASFSACFTCKPYLFHWAEILDLRWIQPSPIEPNFTAGPSKCWCFSGTSNHGLANKWRYMLCTRGYNRNVVFPPLFLIQVLQLAHSWWDSQRNGENEKSIWNLSLLYIGTQPPCEPLFLHWPTFCGWTIDWDCSLFKQSWTTEITCLL